jgi:hypothetical protein
MEDYSKARSRGIIVENDENLDDWEWCSDDGPELSIKFAPRDLGPVYRESARLLLDQMIESALFGLKMQKGQALVYLNFFESTVDLAFPLTQLVDEWIKWQIHENYGVKTVDEFHKALGIIEDFPGERSTFEQGKILLRDLEVVIAKLRPYLEP